MKFASVTIAGRPSWGIIEDNTFCDLGALLAHRVPDLSAAIATGDLKALAMHKVEAHRYDVGDLAWLPVIPEPSKIICVGLNYEKHRKETGRAEVAHPTIFLRVADSQTGHGCPILRPKVSTQLDYEGELAVIIGKPGRYIPAAEAWSYVAGYSCYNDGSIRDWQWHTHQFSPGKNFPQTGAFGPMLVTPDEVGDLASLRLQTRLNGEVMQDAVFGDMIFDIPTLIEYASSFTPLAPGDVIVSGTPGGVGAKRKPPVWMKPGDVVEVEIDRVGLLINTIADE
ncbi:fumarylacetoacetate hydrolase family protein [Endobacter medicaginis]|nr:fumarylacetoacetate hydrolase family protein [Endobacter medicaginis]NVN29878.1 fumarylacetoacetate hydrolase family protein [Endobacter medicaginis]